MWQRICEGDCSMKSTTFFIIGLFIFCLNLMGCADQGNDQVGYNDKIVGNALLDNIVSTLSQLSASGKGGREAIEPHLYSWWKEMKKAREQGLIDQVFFIRYKRILVVIMLNLVTDEKNIIINSLIHEKIEKFDIPPIDDSQNMAGIGSIAKALKEEITSLKKYLNNK
jgi:hypothetical protein